MRSSLSLSRSYFESFNLCLVFLVILNILCSCIANPSSSIPAPVAAAAMDLGAGFPIRSRVELQGKRSSDRLFAETPIASTLFAVCVTKSGSTSSSEAVRPPPCENLEGEFRSVGKVPWPTGPGRTTASGWQTPASGPADAEPGPGRPAGGAGRTKAAAKANNSVSFSIGAVSKGFISFIGRPTADVSAPTRFRGFLNKRAVHNDRPILTAADLELQPN